jgi:formylglycine-generating enzyme required for sulfatase activity
MWYAWPRLEEWITPPQESGMPLEVSNLARKIRDRFLGEFDSLQRAPGSGQILQEDLIFVPIGPLSDGSWNVAVGHPEEEDNQPRVLEEPLGPYSVSKYPITQRLYTLFDRNHQVHFQDDYKQYSKGPRCPVIRVNWYDAQMFSIWCKSRLLSEWEWEYACRGNRDSGPHRNLTHWELDPKNDSEREKVAWIYSNSQGRTWPVDSKQSGSHTNAFDLVDMLGNVWEWTESTYEAGEVSRVLRGGSFVSYGRDASASSRGHADPTLALISYGFRVARAP